MTNVPDVSDLSSSISLPTADSPLTTAQDTVAISITLAQDIESIFPGTRDAMRTIICNLCSIPESVCSTAVVLTFLPGSSSVSATAYVADETAATSAQGNLRTAFANDDAAAATLPSGMTMLPGSEVTITVQPKIAGMAEARRANMYAGVIGAGMVLICCGTCIVASMTAGARRKLSKGTKPRCAACPCCSTGCCSIYSIEWWAKDILFAALFLVGGAMWKYSRIDGLVTSVSCIAAQIVNASQSDSQLGQAVGGAMPAAALNYIDMAGPYMQYFGIGVLLPTLLVAILFIIVGVCELHPRGQQHFCIAKTIFLLSFLLTLIAMIIAIIFAAVGYIMNVPQAEQILSMVNAMCDQIGPTLQQTIADGQNAIALAQAAGSAGDDSAMTDMQDVLQQGREAEQIVSVTCGCIDDMLASISSLFAPSFVCLSAQLYAIYVSCSMCTSAGCCCSPDTKTYGELTRARGKPVNEVSV